MKIRPMILVLVVIVLSAMVCPYALSADGSDHNAAFDTPPQPAGGVEAPLYRVKYPEAALKDGIEGKVLVSVVIGTDGRTRRAEILESVRKDLDQAALEAVRQTQWEPARKDGQPVQCRVVVPVQFELEKKSK